LLILVMSLDDLGRYPVGIDWKVEKLMHFGTIYFKELPSH